MNKKKGAVKLSILQELRKDALEKAEKRLYEKRQELNWELHKKNYPAGYDMRDIGDRREVEELI